MIHPPSLLLALTPCLLLTCAGLHAQQEPAGPGGAVPAAADSPLGVFESTLNRLAREGMEKYRQRRPQTMEDAHALAKDAADALKKVPSAGLPAEMVEIFAALQATAGEMADALATAPKAMPLDEKAANDWLLALEKEQATKKENTVILEKVPAFLQSAAIARRRNDAATDALLEAGKRHGINLEEYADPSPMNSRRPAAPGDTTLEEFTAALNKIGETARKADATQGLEPVRTKVDQLFQVKTGRLPRDLRHAFHELRAREEYLLLAMEPFEGMPQAEGAERTAWLQKQMSKNPDFAEIYKSGPDVIMQSGKAHARSLQRLIRVAREVGLNLEPFAGPAWNLPEAKPANGAGAGTAAEAAKPAAK